MNNLLLASKNLHEIKLNGETSYKGSFLHVQRDEVTLPDGKTASREYIKHPGAVVIIPVLDDGRILLEKQFRYPLDKIFIEFPAGKIDSGEDPLECAKRELREETGYTAVNWEHLCTIHNAIAYSDEHLEIYLARGLKEGVISLDDGEFLETFTAMPKELMEWIRAGHITDVKTIIGAFWLEKILSNQWPLDSTA